ncbi:3-keto-disaccharide hydrolase [Wenyingzhuangia aestuarii]|uniref:3-keto-disaccharide hydrolase n=1 Tax=Wenyingzhuangia aestuarii TaxID=1647582 RepID=UPI00143A683F|nr:DUF1080 domain-containing protein [Wenyingzhuangia aestuarii]NJB81317.1 hypothetical protein [Wenyingzhuangia aestuarii]
MRQLFLLSTIFYLSFSTFSLAQQYKPLYNQKNLDDFTVEGGKATYTTKNGIITGYTALESPNTFLATKKVYGDFELIFKVKVDKDLNSGVQIRSRKRETTLGKFKTGKFYGPQVEIESKNGVAGYIYGEAMQGGWKSLNRKSHIYFKVGEWNEFKIIAKGAQIKTFINGFLVENLIDTETYKTHPKGHIGLQIHAISKKKLGTKKHLIAQWKDLKIKEL